MTAHIDGERVDVPRTNTPLSEDEAPAEGVSDAVGGNINIPPHAKSVEIKKLEKELEAAKLELSTVESERDRQRKELEQVTQEHEALKNQKDNRTQRNKLLQQMDDLQETVDKKQGYHDKAMENLEETKSHNRQLKRTLKILQGAVQGILEKSAHDPDSSEQGKQRAYQRQQLLREVLSQHDNWKTLSLTPSDDLPDEDEDIRGDGHTHPIRKFTHKNRYDSIESMVSEIISLHPEETKPAEESASRRSHSRSTRSRSHNRTRSRSKSRSAHSRSQSKSRSRSGSADRSRSQSRSRKGGGRPRKSKDGSSNERDADISTKDDNVKRKSSLAAMLENEEGKSGTEEASQDTPKTCNTTDMP